MVGSWLCQFNRGMLLCGGCVCYCVGVVFVIVIFVWLLKFNNVVWDKIGEVWGWSCIRRFFEFEIGTLDKGLLDLWVSHFFFVPCFGVSSLCLKCTEHVGCNSDVVQWRMYVRTEGGRAKGIGWEGVSGAVVKIVMNWCVVYKTGNWMSSWATGGFWGRTVLHDIDCCSL